jgi:hypothetical protein
MAVKKSGALRATNSSSDCMNTGQSDQRSANSAIVSPADRQRSEALADVSNECNTSQCNKVAVKDFKKT